MGIELDKEAFEKSQLLKFNSISIDFKEIEISETLFDTIVLWKVFEHLQNSISFLK